MSAHRIHCRSMMPRDSDSRMSIVVIAGAALVVVSMVSGWFFHGLLLILGAWVVWAMILELRARLIESELAFVSSILVGAGLLIGVSWASG